MSQEFGLALMLDGSSVSALVVGGGRVAERKAVGLLDGGADVRVLARDFTPGLIALARREPRLTISRGEYEAGAIGEATLVVAATDDRAVNRAIAGEATSRRLLVVVADAPDEGNCVTPAVHRTGSLLVAVTAGGLPGAAARVRDAIALRFDARYAAAVAELRGLRRRMIAAGERSAWREAAHELIGDEFCEAVERGTLAERITSWR